MRLRIASLLYLSSLVCLSQPVQESDPEVGGEVGDFFGPGATGAYISKNGMVATASVHSTLAGLEILRQGGNAFDAAVAVQLALTVVEPYGSGIGGGLFAMIYVSEKEEVLALDGREESPEFLDPSQFRDARGKMRPFRDRITGGHPIGVPGAVASCQWLLDNYGTMTFSEVAQPAIRLARNGFPIPEIFAANLQKHWSRLLKDPESSRLFLGTRGRPLQAGEIFANPELADTLEYLAKTGTSDFYRGQLAKEIVGTVQNEAFNPGQLSLEDMERYRPLLRSPIEFSFGKYKLYGMPPPSSGGITLAQMIGLLAGEDGSFTAEGESKIEFIYRFLEVQNLAFADRNRWIGDSDFFPVPIQGLLNSNYLSTRRALLHSGRALETPISSGQPPVRSTRALPESESTTHFSIVDRDRNMIAVTTTLEQHFGSAVTVPGRGFLLNNQLTDLTPGPEGQIDSQQPNIAAPGLALRKSALGLDAKTEGGQRPRSSMSPTLIFKEGKPWLSIGSPGGSRIIGTVFNVIVQLIREEMPLQKAVNAPRMIARNGPAELEAPLFRDDALVESLKEIGFVVRDAKATGSVQAILVNPNGFLEGAADPRREGSALGY